MKKNLLIVCLIVVCSVLGYFVWDMKQNQVIGNEEVAIKTFEELKKEAFLKSAENSLERVFESTKWYSEGYPTIANLRHYFQDYINNASRGGLTKEEMLVRINEAMDNLIRYWVKRADGNKIIAFEKFKKEMGNL